MNPTMHYDGKRGEVIFEVRFSAPSSTKDVVVPEYIRNIDKEDVSVISGGKRYGPASFSVVGNDDFGDGEDVSLEYFQIQFSFRADQMRVPSACAEIRLAEQAYRFLPPSGILDTSQETMSLSPAKRPFDEGGPEQISARPARLLHWERAWTQDSLAMKSSEVRILRMEWIYDTLYSTCEVVLTPLFPEHEQPETTTAVTVRGNVFLVNQMGGRSFSGDDSLHVPRVRVLAVPEAGKQAEWLEQSIRLEEGGGRRHTFRRRKVAAPKGVDRMILLQVGQEEIRLRVPVGLCD
jgi:hypothetical protein